MKPRAERLNQCAQHFRKKPKVSKELTRRQEGVNKEVKELSWRMQNRLHNRYLKLRLRQKEMNKCIIAMAREILGFIWELQHKCNLPLPEMNEVDRLVRDGSA